MQGKGEVAYKAVNIFDDTLLCFKIPVYVIDDLIKNTIENCTKNN